MRETEAKRTKNLGQPADLHGCTPKFILFAAPAARGSSGEADHCHMRISDEGYRVAINFAEA
jgi:hypothetical protein